MGRFSESATVDASIDTTFGFVTDQSQVAKWNHHVEYVEVIGGGPVEVGSRLRQHRRRNNREFDLEFTVTQHQPPRLHVVEGEVFGVETAMTFEFEPQPDGGTEVTMAAITQGRGLARLLAPLVTSEMRKSTRAALTDLRRLLGTDHEASP
jgi:uncharacterized protein YndB with AHSA1/START domain